MAASAYLLDYYTPRLNEIRYQFLLPTIDDKGVQTETAHELVATRCQDDGRIEISLPAAYQSRPLPAEARQSVLKALKAATGLEASSVEDFDLSPSVSDSSVILRPVIG
jgi:hypothetical protein